MPTPIRWARSRPWPSIRRIPKILYVAAGNKESSALFVSRDYGQKWQKQADLPEVPRRIWVDPNSAAESRSIFLAGPHNIAVVNGSEVQKQPLAFDFNDISLGFQKGAQPTLYATSPEGAFVSKDGGASWQKMRTARRGNKGPRGRDQPSPS